MTPAKPTKTLVLVGPPNVGKSVLFHRLTGTYATVSNYSGTTVDVTRGRAWLADEAWHVVDTPGVNGLLPHSEDERVTRDFLLRDRPDVVLNVLDAKNLKRGLSLTLELGDYRIPLVVALNLADEALDRGVRVSATGLEERLGVPVVSTVATTGEGVPELKKALARARPLSVPQGRWPEVDRSLERLDRLFAPRHPARRAVGVALLAGDDTILTRADDALARPGSEREVYEAAEKERARFALPARTMLFNARESVVRELVAETVTLGGRLSPTLSQRLGRWTLRPWPGYAIGAVLLWAVYQFVGVFGAGTAVDFLENTVFGRYITPGVAWLVERWLPWAFVRDLLVGPYGVVSMALSYALALILPIVSTFFLAFGLLEDSGYLPRLSVLLDRLFRLMGLNGRAVLPVLLGLGCDTMATMTTRILDTPKERVIVTLLLALSIPCSAQLAVILGMAAGLSPRVLLVWLVTITATTLLAGSAAARLLPGARAPFLMEIPPIRRPLFRNIYLKMRVRLTWYMKEVVPLFIYGTLGLFFLDRWGWLRGLERAFSPVVQGWLGLPAEATQTFLIGFLRRDYGAAGLYSLQKEGAMDLRQITVSLVLITLFMPCVAQWLMMIKERGWVGALSITLVVLTVALGVAGLVNGILLAWPGLVG